MAILQIQTSQTGLVGVLPVFIYINTNDTQSTVLTAGYLNSAASQGYIFNNHQMALVYTTDMGPGLYQVSVSGSTYSLVSTSLSVPLSVSQGGTGLITATTPYGVVCAGTTATGAFQVINSLGTAGQVFTSNGAAALPSWQAASGGVTWIDQTTTPVTIVKSNGYFANNAGLVTLNMPATAAVGDTFYISGKGAGGWLLRMNTGQVVNLGSTPSSSAGSLASTNQFDSITVVCQTANTTFNVTSVIGNITVA